MFFSCSTCCRHSGYSYFAFLPSGALFSFEVIGFIERTLVEEAKLISIKYIFQLIIGQYDLQGCFIPKTGDFICSRPALSTGKF